MEGFDHGRITSQPEPGLQSLPSLDVVCLCGGFHGGSGGNSSCSPLRSSEPRVSPPLTFTLLIMGRTEPHTDALPLWASRHPLAQTVLDKSIWRSGFSTELNGRPTLMKVWYEVCFDVFLRIKTSKNVPATKAPCRMGAEPQLHFIICALSLFGSIPILKAAHRVFVAHQSKCTS